MNQQTVEQVRHLRGLVESVRGVISDLQDCEERSRLIEIVPLFDKHIAALSSAESEPTISRIALTEFVDKYCSGDSALTACAEAAFFAFNLSAGASPSSAHSDVSQGGGRGNVKPLWEELAEIGQEAAAKGAFDQPEAPALTDEDILMKARDAELWEERRGGVWIAIGGQAELIAFARALLSSPVQAAVEPMKWKATRYASIPHPHELGMRIVGIVLPADQIEPKYLPKEALANALGASPDAQAIREAAKDALGCFEAAEIEGLSIALAETRDERLKDLVMRRLMHAPTYLQEALKSQAPQVKDAPASLTSGEGKVRQAEADERPLIDDETVLVLQRIAEFFDTVKSEVVPTVRGDDYRNMNFKDVLRRVLALSDSLNTERTKTTNTLDHLEDAKAAPAQSPATQEPHQPHKDGKYVRAWLQLDALPGGMMQASDVGLYGPVPGSCSAWLTTSETEVSRWRAKGEPTLEVWVAQPQQGETK